MAPLLWLWCGGDPIASCFTCAVLLNIPTFAVALGAKVGGPAPSCRPAPIVSSWAIPRGVKFGKLSNLAFLPSEDPLSPLGESSDEMRGGVGENGDGGEGRQIRVATAAVGLNFADVFTVLGLYKAANLVREGSGTDRSDGSPGGLLAPFVPGIEFAGVVLDDGGDFRRGDRVFGFTRFGAYSDVVRARPEFVRRIPESWSFEEGAAFLVNVLTAWHGLVNVGGMPDLSARSVGGRRRAAREGPPRPYVVVVHSASGGVGLWASEIAARRGAAVVGVVGSEEKKKAFMDRVDRLCGAAQCIVRASSADEFDRNLAEACQKARNTLLVGSSAESPLPVRTCLEASEAGCGADLVMESYGGKYFRPSIEVINPGGSLTTYGSTTYNDSGSGEAIPFLSLVWNYLRRPRLDPGELTGRNIRVGGFNLIFLTENTDMLVDALDGCVECLCGAGDDSIADFDNRLEHVRPPLIGSVLPFKDGDGGGAVNALKVLRSGKTVGKVVLDNRNNPSLC